jgi:hypothetical protein
MNVDARRDPLRTINPATARSEWVAESLGVSSKNQKKLSRVLLATYAQIF